jgi:hypothetical protein
MQEARSTRHCWTLGPDWKRRALERKTVVGMPVLRTLVRRRLMGPLLKKRVRQTMAEAWIRQPQRKRRLPKPT